MNKYRFQNLAVRLFQYEYWPWWMFYLPVLPYWLWLSLKSKSLLYFTAANPGIEMGGFFGESKIEILKKIPEEFLCKSIYFKKEMDADILLTQIKKAGWNFPLVLKPNIGERGTGVEKINSEKELVSYLSENKNDLIVQEFSTLPVELGILYCRIPGKDRGEVTSVTLKEFLAVTGDGRNNVEQLMLLKPRSRFQIDRFSKENKEILAQIPGKGEMVLLEPIGNHCRGTKFINANHLICDDLNEVFDRISTPIEGFYYGRFDLKVKSFEDLKKGSHIKIMELNGVSSEPGHIYDPEYPIFRAYRDLVRHWDLIYKISKENRKKGYSPVPVSLFLKTVWNHFRKKIYKPGNDTKT